jgi:CHAT domain-containing protein/tetratricopeptide (TPR) repeat protein
MVVDRLVGNGVHRLIVAGVLLAVLGFFGAPLRVRAAAPPATKPLTEEQKARLEERDRLFVEVTKQYQAGKLAEAVAALQKAVAIQRQVFGNRQEELVKALESLAFLQELRGDFGASGKARKEVLAIATKLYGGKDWRTIDAQWEVESLNRRARLSPADRKQLTQADELHRQEQSLYRKGRYKEALSLGQKVVEVRKRLLSEDHPSYANSLNTLALAYLAMADYRSALPLQQRARELRKKLLTEDHPGYAQSLNNLAALYRAMQDYRSALPLFQQALALRKKLLTEDHPDYARSLHNLASVYHSMGDYRSALPLYRQALDLRKKLLTEDHRDYAMSLDNLAGLYKEMGDHRRALALYHYAQFVYSLGDLYLYMGDYRRALPLFQQALNLRKRLLSEDHPAFATNLNGLAALHYRFGKAKAALPLCQEGLARQKKLLDSTFGILSNRQRLDFAKKQQVWLSVFLSMPRGPDTSAGTVYNHVLAFKGVLAARQAEEQLARDQPKLQLLFEQLRRVRASLATVSRQAPATREQQADWRGRFDALQKDKEQLEVSLAQQSGAFRRFHQLRDATATEVAATLPANVAFIDFLFYTHYTPPPDGKGNWLTEARLLAFVLARGRDPVLVTLGDARPIMEAVAAWRQAVGKAQSPDKPGRELGRLLWAKLRPHLGRVDAVLIAPDGVLCGLPFGALPGRKEGTYLVEELAIGYVNSGRHLLELDADKDGARGEGLVAVGGLDYGPLPAKAKAALAPLAFEPLPGTRLEAERIARLYRVAFAEAQLPRRLAGPEADAARLKKELPPAVQAGPRYLHLATHAFFEAPPPEIKGQKAAQGWDPDRQDRTFGRNPLLLSGLVLAGANRSYEKGILTAEEVASMDLRGVELAVLSACETGLGRVDYGEGVLGLQRGFQMAGARSMAVSLWSVNDAATSVLMEEFYTNLWVKKLPKLKALQQAQVTVLRNPGRVLQRGRELGALLAKEGVSANERAWLAQRGIYKKVEELPDGGKVVELKRSPPASWAAFVLYGDGR